MDREILFRGKRVDNSKWAEGWYCTKKTGHYEGDRFVEGMQHIIIISMTGGGYQYAVVDPRTVCQYTGLTDKNEKKIFEGDIVKINNDVKEAFEISDGAVVYRGGSFIIGGSNGNGTLNSLFAITDINYVLRGEVIGNIFDNPAFLEGGAG